MEMPKTYFDCIQYLRPKLLDEVTREARFLLESKNALPILSTDEYESRLNSYLTEEVDKVLYATATHMGVPLSVFKQNLSTLPADFSHSYLLPLITTINHEFHFCLNFLLAGKKTFFFSNEISQNLVHTEINVPAVEVQLPFYNCQLVFSEPEVINAFYAKAIQDNPNLVIDYDSPVSVFVTLYDFCDGLDGRRIIFHSYHSKYPRTVYMMQKRELFLGNNWSLEQSLSTEWEQLTPDNLGNGVVYNDGEIKDINDELFYTDGMLFYRIILNAILYITSIKTEFTKRNSKAKDIEKRLSNAKSYKKKEELRKELNKLSCLDYFDIGYDENPIVSRKDKEKTQYINANSMEQQVLRRFMVRGHWRKQRYGSDLSKTKLIWIKPYIKGDELSEFINKPYVIKE